MATTIKVDAVTREPRIWQGKTTWGVKNPNGEWVTLYREAKPAKGETIDVNITERNVKGRLYVDAFPVMPPLAPPETTSSNGNGPKADDTWSQNSGKKVPWEGCIVFAKAAHELALELEPDSIRAIELSDPNDSPGTIATIDRSTARAAILNTLMIAYTGGKILVAKEEDEYAPPPEDEGAPF